MKPKMADYASGIFSNPSIGTGIKDCIAERYVCAKTNPTHVIFKTPDRRLAW